MQRWRYVEAGVGTGTRENEGSLRSRDELGGVFDGGGRRVGLRCCPDRQQLALVRGVVGDVGG